MKKAYKIMAIILCGAVLITACGKKASVMNEELQVEEVSPVEVMLVQKGSIENEYMYSGAIKSANEIKVSTLISGKVASVRVDVGDAVKAGDVLFTIDTGDMEDNIKALTASLESAEASINSAKTNLELVNGATVQSQIEGAKTTLSNSELTLSNVEISLSKAKLDYENNKELYDLGIISEDAYIQYRNAYDMAKINYEQVQVAHQQALKMYDITVNKMPEENRKRAQDSLTVAQASKKSLVVQLENARGKLKDATVTSPISGVVSQSNIKQGEFLAMGAVVPMTIIDNSRVNIEVGLSEQVINKVQLGDLTKVFINSIAPEFMQGTIISIEPAARQDNTYGVKIEIDNQAGLLKPGMFGEVYFTNEKSEDAIILPRNAVLEDNEGYYVFVEEGDIAKKINVTIGIEREKDVEVISGLSENMKVVTVGQNFIQDGDKLMIASNGKEQ